MDALQRWFARRRASGLFHGVLLPSYVGLTALAVAVAVGLALWDALAPGFTGGCPLHLGAALSGSSDVFARDVAPGCSGLDAGAARSAIAADYAFILLYASGGAAALWWLWPRAWRISRMRALRPVALTPVAAGIFDVFENAFVLAGLGDGPSLGEMAARAAAIAGWWKWMLVVASLLALIACVCGALGNRSLPPAPRPPSRRGEPGPVREEIGICLSGGGIRSAGFALGALRALDRRKLLLRARWIAAVSGGAYTAGAWFIGRGSAAEERDVVPHPRDGVDGLLEPPGPPDLFEYLRKNRRYLSTGRGGLPATFVTGGLLSALNATVLASLVCLVSWPVGRVAATWAIQPNLRRFGYSSVGEQVLDVPPRLWLPGAFGVAVAALCWIVALFLWDPARRNVMRAAGFFSGGGAVLLALLVGVPVAMTETPKLWESLHANPLWGAGIASIASVGALAFAVVWIVLRPFAAVAKRVGGLLLALLAILLAGRVATDAAYDEGTFAASVSFYGAALAAFCLVYLVANAQSWSLFRLYYLRLRSTFSTTQKRARRARGAPAHAGVYPLSLADEPSWPAYAGRSGPELLVCAAAQSNDPGVAGVHAQSFTLSPDEIALRGVGSDTVVSPDDYFRALRSPGRWGPRLGSVSAGVAMSGAAFTSAMGRHSLGTTNALLAALNVRFGVWMPNPAYPAPEGPLKKPRIGYLLKEVFGVYDRDDPYLYVTDGGHWENLGLVELIRRRTRWIFCVDASGDRLGSFRTLEEAAALARVECGAEIELDAEPLRGRDGRLPKSAVATWVIRYHTCGGTGPDECETGLLFYGKAMLAGDSPINTLSFSLRDRIYPRYPTYDQFLSEDELANLVRLGEWVGRGLALDFERYGPPP